MIEAKSNSVIYMLLKDIKTFKNIDINILAKWFKLSSCAHSANTQSQLSKNQIDFLKSVFILDSAAI